MLKVHVPEVVRRFKSNLREPPGINQTFDNRTYLLEPWTLSNHMGTYSSNGPNHAAIGPNSRSVYR
jgi:hypothetical protein